MEGKGIDSAGPGLRATLITSLPFAIAIGVFGVVYGAAASAIVDPWIVIGSSFIIFSGSLQFALVALLANGAGSAVLVFTAIVLNLRHLVFGALLRPRLEGPLWRRFVLGFFMIDESFGLALASRRRTAMVLAVSGMAFYVAWQVGTVLGVLGARAVALEEVSRAIFPVLFIGLAALTARGMQGALRAFSAAALVFATAFLAPGLFDYAPIIAAIVVALPSLRSSAVIDTSEPSE